MPEDSQLVEVLPRIPGQVVLLQNSILAHVALEKEQRRGTQDIKGDRDFFLRVRDGRAHGSAGGKGLWSAT